MKKKNAVVRFKLHWKGRAPKITQNSQNTEYKIQNTEYRIQKTEYRKQNTEYRIQNTEYRIQNTEYRIQNTEYRIQIAEYRIQLQQTLCVTNVPFFYIALGLMILMGANPLLGLLEGWALKMDLPPSKSLRPAPHKQQKRYF
jgi:hypothetical protein